MSIRSEQQYKSMLPKTGKLVKSDGTLINEADLKELDASTNNGIASRRGKVYRAFIVATSVPANTTVDFILSITNGYDLFGLTRATSAELGSIVGQFLIADGFGDVLDTATGYNFDETLNDTSPILLSRVSSVSNAVARTPELRIAVPSTGPASARIASEQSLGGFQPKFDNLHIPVFRYRTLADPATIKLEITWQEVEK